MNQLDDLIPDAPRAPSIPVILYGEVESIDPLVITVDGDEDPLEIEPSTTVDGILPGDKVAMTLQNDELIVTGIIDGDVDYVEEFSEGIAVAQEASISASLAAAEAAAQAAAAHLAANNAQTSADGKNRVYYQTAQPSGGSYIAGDTWFDTDDSNRIYRYNGTSWVATSLGSAALSDGAITAAKLAAASVDSTKLASAVNTAISSAQSAASTAQTAANAAQATANTAVTNASTAQSAADSAASAASTAAGIANGKADVLIQSSTPAAGMQKATTLWIDTTGGNNTPKRWNGTSWVVVTDKAATDAAAAAVAAQSTASAAQADATAAAAIASAAQSAASAAQSTATSAASAASAAQTTANGKSKVTRSTSTPSGGGSAGDQWWRISGADVIGLWIYDGSSWVQQAIGSAAISNGAVDATKLASAVNTAISTAQTTANNAASAAATAQTTADGKGRAYYQATAPAGGTYSAQDVWFNTSDGNKVCRWNGSAWVAVQFGNSAIADAAITNAKIADATIQNAKIGSLDAGKVTTGTLSADRIAAGTIATSKLAVADLENIWPAPYFAPTDPVVFGANKKLATDAGVPAGCPAPTCGQLTLRDHTSSDRQVCRAGDKFYIEAWVVADGTATKPFILHIEFRDSNMLNPTWVNAGTLAPASATSWTKYSGVYTAPAGAALLRPIVAVNGTSGVDTNGWYATGITVRRMDSAELIVDGAITASKIAAGAVETDKLAANAVTATKIATGAITAGSAIIADGAITNAKIANLDAAKITTGTLAADRIDAASITGAKIAAGTIAASNLIAGTITAASGVIADAAIGGANIIDASITEAKIADASIGNAKISNLDVAKLVGDRINGNFVVAGSFEAKADMGGRVVMDSAGIRAYDGASQLATNIDTSGNSTFRGQVEASGVEVLGKLKFHGYDSEVAAGARLNITGGVTPPGTSPNIYAEWPIVQLQGVPKTYITGVTRDPANGDLIVASMNASGAPTATRHSASTGALTATLGTFPTPSGYQYPANGGIAFVDGVAWVPLYINTYESLAYYTVTQIVSTAGTTKTIIAKSASYMWSENQRLSISNASSTQIAMALYDFTRSSDKGRLLLYTPSTSTASGNVACMGVEAAAPPVAYGSFDFGATRFVLDATGVAKAYQTSGAADATKDWGTGRSVASRGIGYYGSTFWTAQSDGKVYTYDGPNADAIEFAASWYDSTTAGTGKHETPLGPSGWSQTGIKRARLRVHPPLLTTTPGDDGVDSVRLYARVSGTMRLQGTLSTPGTSLLITGALASGVAHGGEAGFPATSPGSIENSTGDIVLPGNGPAQLKTINIPKILAGETISDLPAGLYMPGDSGLITTGRGYPVTGLLGMLEVIGSVLGNGDIHRYTSIEAVPRIFLRSRVGGSWSSWTVVGGAAKPRARGVITASKSMASGTNTITGWTEEYDIGAGFDPSTGVYTVPTGEGGLYALTLSVAFGTDSTRRFIVIESPSGTPIARVEGPATGYSQMSLSTELELSAGATLVARTYCAAAANIRGDQCPTSFTIRRVE